MRSFFLAIFFACMCMLNAQEYVQYESIYLKPDTKSLATLAKNMKAHNDKYHSENPYHANVWQVINGPKAGWLVWIMGPSTFREMDARPAEGGHDDDWQNNVMPYVVDMGNIEYWRRFEEVSILGDPQPNLKVRFYQVNNDMGFLVDEIWEKMSKVRSEMPEGRSWALYNNMFQQGNMGRHFAGVTPFKNMAELDNGMNLDPSASGTFRKTFERIYGPEAWQPFQNAMRSAFVNSYDEVWALMPNMSAPPTDN